MKMASSCGKERMICGKQLLCVYVFKGKTPGIVVSELQVHEQTITI